MGKTGIAFFKLNRRIKRRLGDNVYLLLMIMAVILVFTGLMAALLDRGFLAAWFFVLLGITAGFFPCIDYFYLRKRHKNHNVTVVDFKQEREEALFNELFEIEKNVREKARSAGIRDSYNQILMTDRKEKKLLGDKAAIELEAMLIKRQLEQKALEERQKREEEEEAARLQRILKQKEEFSRISRQRREAERLYKEKKDREERKRREESNQRAASGTGRIAGNTIKKAGGGNSFFTGVKNGEQLKKRYKDLIKLYHPDNGGPKRSAETIMQIKQEYAELSRFFASYDKHNK